MNWKAIAAAGALALAAGSAHATVFFYGYGIGAPTLTLLDNFSTDTVGAAPSSTAAYTWTGAGKIFKGTSAISSAPATSSTTRDTGNYLSVLLGKTATLTLAKPVKEIEIYIGSLDNYNTLSFSDGESFTGTALNILSAADDNSNQTGGSSNGLFDFKFATPVTSVTFKDDTYNAFEVASIYTAAAVPEPATWAMMLMGLFGLGAVIRSARRSPAASAAA